MRYVALIVIKLIALSAFTSSGLAQELGPQCRQNVADLCGNQDASTCFADTDKWAGVLPACEGEVQMLVEMANQALSDLEMEGASLGGNVRSEPGTEFAAVGSLAEGALVVLEENTGTMFQGFPWFRITQYDMSNGAELMSGYQWGGILCSFIDRPGVSQICPVEWTDNPAIIEHVAGAMITEDAIAPVHGNSDEDNADIDVARIEACIRNEHDSGGDGSACIGSVSTPCLADDAQGTTASMRDCISFEHAAWDRLLNEDYQTLLASLGTEADRESLRDAQRHWIAFVAAFCPLSFQFNGGSLNVLNGDICLMEMTARQDLELRELIGRDM